MSRVLLVEDEPAIADALVYALETECFTVTHALTGADALAAAEREPHDFAILDIGLPDMTGLDVCRRLHESSSIPVLFLTARDGELDRILGLELGGDDYVTKPFSPREVVALRDIPFNFALMIQIEREHAVDRGERQRGIVSGDHLSG